VVRGTLVLVQLPEFFAASLPPDAVMTILDRDGTIVARSADPHRWTGQNARGMSVADFALRRGEGTAEAAGVDGVSRQYGFSSVPELGWHIYVGIPTARVMQPVRQMFVRGNPARPQGGRERRDGLQRRLGILDEVSMAAAAHRG